MMLRSKQISSLPFLVVLISLFFSSRAIAEVLPLWKIPLDSLTEMQSRPLFTENRQGLRDEPPPPPPPPPLETPVVVAPPETLQATLLGVLRSADEFGLAVVKELSGEKIRHIKIGENFQGWTLSSLSSGEAIFEREGQRVKLMLPKHQFKGAQVPSSSDGAPTSLPGSGAIPNPTFPEPEPQQVDTQLPVTPPPEQ